MVSCLKKSVSLLLVCIIVMSIVITVPVTEVSAATDVTVNLSSEKQVIRGFGGINHPVWIGDLTETQRETAFGNGENQLGFTILRISVDENKSNWYREIPTAKKAIEKGAIVFASPWNPPSDMTETFDRNGDTTAKRLRYDKYAAYAQHLNDFVTYMKDNGVDLYAISVQNEPDYAHTWTWWTPDEILRFMKENAGSINCRVIAPESFSYLKNMSDPILNDPQALANMDILGAHTYGTQVKDFPYPLFKEKGAGKDLWMTEVYVPNSESNSADRWPEALDVAEHIHNSMVEADFQAYVWWYIRRQYGPMKEDGTISKRGDMMAQFSKFVRPGYVRVDATKNPGASIYTSAYKGDNKVVIVAINKGTSEVSQNFVLQNLTSGTVSSASTWISDSTRKVAAGPSVPVSGGSFTAKLPAQSVTTFVADVTTNVPVTGVSVDKTSLSLAAGSSETLTATIAPADAANKNMTWTTSNSSVANVDNTGKITAVAPGTATITVTTEDGNYNATCNLTVTSSSVNPFTITGSGVLERTGGIKATVSVAPTQGSAAHNGDEVVVFQLMKGSTPVSIVALVKDISLSEDLTAFFNVPNDTAYTVRAYVLDSFSSDLTSAPISLAESVTLN